MKLTGKLLGHLNRPFDRDPDAVDAMVVGHAASMAWQVADGILTLSVPGDATAYATFDLSAHTLTSLVAAVDALAGYTAVIANGVDGSRTALTLLDGSGAASNPLRMYRSLLWVQMEAAARQLTLAKAAIAGMLSELRLDQSTGDWVDLWDELTINSGRRTAEADAAFRSRIERTILRIKTNNKALEKFVLEETDVAVTIEDIAWLVPGAAIHTYGEQPWANAHVTGAPEFLTAPGYTVDGTAATRFGLTLLPDGRPAWGDPNNGNPLVCAFAVIFPVAATCADQAKVMKIVNANRAAGTYGIPYRESVAPMDTNDAADITNDAGDVTGPVTSTFTAWSCP